VHLGHKAAGVAGWRVLLCGRRRQHDIESGEVAVNHTHGGVQVYQCTRHVSSGVRHVCDAGRGGRCGRLTQYATVNGVTQAASVAELQNLRAVTNTTTNTNNAMIRPVLGKVTAVQTIWMLWRVTQQRQRCAMAK
jgi:hypothetical protein